MHVYPRYGTLPSSSECAMQDSQCTAAKRQLLAYRSRKRHIDVIYRKMDSKMWIQEYPGCGRGWKQIIRSQLKSSSQNIPVWPWQSRIPGFTGLAVTWSMTGCGFHHGNLSNLYQHSKLREMESPNDKGLNLQPCLSPSSTDKMSTLIHFTWFKWFTCIHLYKYFCWQ